VLEATKVLKPSGERAIANQFDVRPPIDLTVGTTPQSGVARLYVDDLLRVEYSGLADNAAPTLLVGPCDDVGVRARRARGNEKGISERQAVDGCGETGHRKGGD